ncbi:MAG TPA: Rho termination factor N-terminal domain-containing protein, partial [Dehalococcoidia bacterium]|nr:Rho termination factor N-terminal domain-containing protein [Dehalococcoidia bacterium]
MERQRPPDENGQGDEVAGSQAFASVADLETRPRSELVDIARGLGISGYATMSKQDLVFRLIQAHEQQQAQQEPDQLFSGGVLEIVDDGYGFLRGESLLPSLNDVYVSQSQIRRFGLRTGDFVRGQIRTPKDGEKY